MVAELPAGLQCPLRVTYWCIAGCPLATETLRCGALHTPLVRTAMPLCGLVGASLCKCWSCDVLRLFLPEESQTARKGIQEPLRLSPWALLCERIAPNSQGVKSR